MNLINKLRLPILAILIATLTSCASVKYSADTLLDETSLHHEIAVVPVEINYSGPYVSRLTDDDRRDLDIQESMLFQDALHNALLRKAHKNVKVDVQATEKTNRLLAENGISPIESWSMSPEELAEILHVDAIVRMRVDESRYMSDVAGFGLDLGRSVILERVRNTPAFPQVAGTRVKTADVRASCSIFDGESGTLLWKLGVDRDANWNYTPDQIVDALNRRIARKFPYKW